MLPDDCGDGVRATCWMCGGEHRVRTVPPDLSGRFTSRPRECPACWNGARPTIQASVSGLLPCVAGHRCEITYRPGPDRTVWVQHGANPEAVFCVGVTGRFWVATPEFRDWLRGCHAYADTREVTA